MTPNISLDTTIALGSELKALFTKHRIKNAEVNVNEEARFSYNALGAFKATPDGEIVQLAGPSLSYQRTAVEEGVLA